MVKSRHILTSIHAHHDVSRDDVKKTQSLRLPFIHLKSQTRTSLDFPTQSISQNELKESLSSKI